MTNHLTGFGSTCIIVAHPDDESLFFIPIIENLSTRENLHLLCLTNGNYYGLGKEREKELLSACRLLGIRESNVKIVNNEQIQDQPYEKWEHDAVISEIESFVNSFEINTIFTFDGLGISKHINHISINESVLEWLKSSKRNTYPDVYVLMTCNLLLKYSGVLSLIFHSIFSNKDKLLMVRNYNPIKAFRALMCHKTQVTWYRILFSLISQYNYLNLFRKVN